MSELKADATFLDVLNDLRARELGVIMQYMRQHYIVTGPQGMLLADTFKEVAITEMKHAESLAERIDFLGGDPTTTPTPPKTDFSTLREMAKADYDAEYEAVQLYKRAIALAEKSDDVATRRLLEDILADEEEHLKAFTDMLGGDIMGGELLNPKLVE